MKKIQFFLTALHIEHLYLKGYKSLLILNNNNKIKNIYLDIRIHEHDIGVVLSMMYYT